MPSTIKLTNTDTDRPTVRFMILETDEAPPKTQRDKGSYSEIFDEHFRKAGEMHDPPLNVETAKRFVVTEKGGKMPTVEDFEGFQAVLISGSTFDAHGDNPWILELLELLKGTCPRQPKVDDDDNVRWTELTDLWRQSCGRRDPICASPVFVSAIRSSQGYWDHQYRRHHPTSGSWRTARSI